MTDFFSKEIKTLNEFIKEAQPDLLHAHWQYEYSSAAIRSNIPFVITCHDSPLNVLSHQPGLYRLMRLTMAFNNLRRSANINAVSKYTAKGNAGFTRAFIDVIPNFEPEWIFNKFSPREISGKLKIIMINNGFGGRKNVGVGLKAFKILQEKYSELFEIHLYGGENGNGEKAQKYAGSIGLDHGVFFHGKIPFKDLMNSLFKGDIFLHTALEESCPMVIIEAMAMGIPVIAGQDSGGVPEMLDLGGGILTNVKDPQVVADEIERLLDNEYYRKLSLESNAIARARYHPDVVMEKYIKSYYELLGLKISQYA
jgi:glycosyltransferase involved in cell wall biosynthesis